MIHLNNSHESTRLAALGRLTEDMLRESGADYRVTTTEVLRPLAATQLTFVAHWPSGAGVRFAVHEFVGPTGTLTYVFEAKRNQRKFEASSMAPTLGNDWRRFLLGLLPDSPADGSSQTSRGKSPSSASQRTADRRRLPRGLAGIFAPRMGCCPPGTGTAEV